MRLISDEHLFKCETCRFHRSGGCNTWCDHGESYSPDMSKIPTIDPEDLRPKGEWKVYWCDTSMIGHEYESCSNCGCEIFDTDKFWNCNYCPNCGADMRGKAHG